MPSETAKFFAQLEAFDRASGTETESEDDLDQFQDRKRQKLVGDAATLEPRVTTVAHTGTSKSFSESVATPSTTKGINDTIKVPTLKHAPPAQQAAVTSDAPRQSAKPVRRTRHQPQTNTVADAVKEEKAGLFAGLTFFFLPNDNVAKVRKLRIESATKQGATWARTLDSTVTHIIVDQAISAEAVAKVATGKIDFERVAIVKDRWLSESAGHSYLHAPKSFRLKGADQVFVTNPRTEASSRRGGSAVGSVSKVIPVLTRFDNQPNHDEGEDFLNPADELSQIVQEMKNADHLPFDEEFDLENFVSSGDEQEVDAVVRSSKAKPTPTVPRENRGFACMEPNNGADKSNPNNRTIDILQQMATYYDRTGDSWRTLAYRKAVAALRKQNTLVTTKTQARAIRGIGDRIADKIEEIATTDRLRRLDSVSSDPNDQVLQLFMGVYGAGLQQAKSWMDQGYRTLDDLRVKASLTASQKIGIDHYDDFQLRIPRVEVGKHGAVLQKALKRADRNLKGIIGGSYRRGMPDSGDIDVIITHPTAELTQLRAWAFDDVVPYLFKIGFMKAALATSRSTSKKVQISPQQQRLTVGSDASDLNPSTIHAAPIFASSLSSGTKFHGASALSDTSPWRRIDLLLVPASALGASLLYFTGNDIFNRSMRLLASRKKMRLNQYGLYKNVLRGPGRVKETAGELVEGRSEKRIFEILGVPWREPHERRC